MKDEQENVITKTCGTAQFPLECYVNEPERHKANEEVLTRPVVK